jgi:hypothetical protein
MEELISALIDKVSYPCDEKAPVIESPYSLKGKQSLTQETQQQGTSGYLDLSQNEEAHSPVRDKYQQTEGEIK